MPPWQNRLTADQIWQAVAFAWSLHTTQEQTQQGAEQYATACAACHGVRGAGDGPDAQGLAVNFGNPAYAMLRSQEDWRQGWQAAHPEIGAEWTEQEARNVLEYVRTLSYVPPWQSPLQPGPGVVAGRVLQGTPGGPQPSGAAALEAFAGFEPVGVFTTTLDAEGRFHFEGLAADPNLVYLVSFSAAGIRYTSPLIALTEEQPSAQSDVTIYETTADPSGIQVGQFHWIIEDQPGALLVLQVITFGSSGDRTFVGASVEGADVPVTVAVYVPPEAVELTFQNGALGERFRQVGHLVYDTMPLIPGQATNQIVLQYALPYQEESYQLDQELLYQTPSLNLLIADLPQLEATAPALTLQETREIEGRSYQIWTASDLAPGTVAVELSGLLPPGAPDPRATGAEGAAASLAAPAAPVIEPWAAWLSAAMVTLGLAGVLIWSWQQGNLAPGNRADLLDRQRKELVRSIAHLDDLHVLGELNDEAWRGQRALLKARLLEVVSQLPDQAIR